MTEVEFERLATAALTRIAETLERNLGEVADVDLLGGILTITLDRGGEYVINKHGPNRQIWLSSPRSGASHYGFDAARAAWIGTRSGRALADVLAEEFGPIASGPLTFD
ncbi:MAG: iron donor protein CyaY [Pseudomonadota bacterium]